MSDTHLTNSLLRKSSGEYIPEFFGKRKHKKLLKPQGLRKSHWLQQILIGREAKM